MEKLLEYWKEHESWLDSHDQSSYISESTEQSSRGQMQDEYDNNQQDVKEEVENKKDVEDENHMEKVFKIAMLKEHLIVEDCLFYERYIDQLHL